MAAHVLTQLFVLFLTQLIIVAIWVTVSWRKFNLARFSCNQIICFFVFFPSSFRGKTGRLMWHILHYSISFFVLCPKHFTLLLSKHSIVSYHPIWLKLLNTNIFVWWANMSVYLRTESTSWAVEGKKYIYFTGGLKSSQEWRWQRGILGLFFACLTATRTLRADYLIFPRSLCQVSFRLCNMWFQLKNAQSRQKHFPHPQPRIPARPWETTASAQWHGTLWLRPRISGEDKKRRDHRGGRLLERWRNIEWWYFLITYILEQQEYFIFLRNRKRKSHSFSVFGLF